MVNLDKPAGEIRLHEVSAVWKEITTFIATEGHDLFSSGNCFFIKGRQRRSELWALSLLGDLDAIVGSRTKGV